MLTELQLHQAELFASSLRREIRRARKTELHKLDIKETATSIRYHVEALDFIFLLDKLQSSS